MADNKIFSDACTRLINCSEYDGVTMIATSRAILGNSYSDKEYNNEFFNIFILVDEETGHIVLDGFDDLNLASERHNLSGSSFSNTVKILLGGVSGVASAAIESNTHIYQADIESIKLSYIDQFLSSLSDFKGYFGLGGDAPEMAR